MKKKRRSVWSWIKRVLLFLFLWQLFYIIILRWVDPPLTITQLQSLFGYGLKRDYVSFGKISRAMKLAVIASEDQIFPDHSGFDWKSIRKAMKYNEKKPNRVRGASTISQQVAKNVFLWQGRSWVRKAFEIYFTKMIEWIWGKRRILEVYLNVIETGRGTFGVEAASQQFYKKPALNLSRREAAMIAAGLPNPKKYAVRPASGYVRARANWIVQQMRVLEKDPDVRKLIQ
ncbi:MAG TPA: monofunctional biosynthetic peptidoglycan transglycosylase [Flavisolibacter sp.]